MITLQDIENYCRNEIHKANKELEHKTHLRFRGRKEAFSEILEMIKGFENISLGQIKEMRTGDIWNAVQISETSVRLWRGLNESFFMSIQHFRDAISEDRFRVIE